MTTPSKKLHFLKAVFASVLAAGAAAAGDVARADNVAQNGYRGDVRTGTFGPGKEGLFHVCQSGSGQSVMILISDSLSFKIARARIHNTKGPIIEIEKKLVDGNVPDLFLQFVAAHECAHHELGHLEKRNRMLTHGIEVRSQDYHQFELEADCRAMQTLRLEYGYGEAEVDRIFAMLPDRKDIHTHPANSERLENAKRCIKSYSSSLLP